MKLRNYSVQAMIGVSQYWLDPQELRPLFSRYPDLQGNLNKVGKAHVRLLKTQESSGPNAQRIDELTETIGELDTIHDEAITGVDHGLRAAEAFADDPKEKEAFRLIRQTLLPDGLSIKNAAYLEEAGNASIIAERITPEMRTRLEQTQVGSMTLAEGVDRWFSAADMLGEALLERDRLTGGEDSDRVSAAQVLAARNYWINAVNLLIAAIELEEIDEEIRRQILAPLERAEKLAQSRVVEEDEADEDAPVDDEASDEGEEASDEEASDEEEVGAEGDEAATPVEPVEPMADEV